MPTTYIDSPDTGGVRATVSSNFLIDDRGYHVLIGHQHKQCWSGIPGQGNVCKSKNKTLEFVTPRLASGTYYIIAVAVQGGGVVEFDAVAIRVQSRNLGASAYRIRRMLPNDRKVSARVVEDERQLVRIGTVWNGGSATWDSGNAAWDRTYYGGAD